MVSPGIQLYKDRPQATYVYKQAGTSNALAALRECCARAPLAQHFAINSNAALKENEAQVGKR